MEITTERLVIRRFNEHDADDLYEYLSKEEVVRYEPYEPLTYDQAVQEAKRRSDDQNFYAVSLKSGKLIGNIFFAKGEFETWEIGYVFNSAYWGNGYAAEAAAGLLTEAFQNWNVRRVIAMCNPDNPKSWKLLERLGMRREGHLIKNVAFTTDDKGNPVWQDTYEYGILRDEFLKRI